MSKTTWMVATCFVSLLMVSGCDTNYQTDAEHMHRIYNEDSLRSSTIGTSFRMARTIADAIDRNTVALEAQTRALNQLLHGIQANTRGDNR